MAPPSVAMGPASGMPASTRFTGAAMLAVPDSGEHAPQSLQPKPEEKDICPRGGAAVGPAGMVPAATKTTVPLSSLGAGLPRARTIFVSVAPVPAVGAVHDSFTLSPLSAAVRLSVAFAGAGKPPGRVVASTAASL